MFNLSLRNKEFFKKKLREKTKKGTAVLGIEKSLPGTFQIQRQFRFSLQTCPNIELHKDFEFSDF